MKLLAQVLRTSTSQLLDGVPQRLEDHDPIVRRSLDNLHRFATRRTSRTRRCWPSGTRSCRSTRSTAGLVADARTQAATRTEWAQRHAAKGKRNGGKQPDLFE